MTSITDRELLAFCSLANLKLEFSQYHEWDLNNKKWKYKTIRQLIQAELDGIDYRKKNSLYEKSISIGNKKKENKENEAELEKLQILPSNDTDATTLDRIKELEGLIAEYNKDLESYATDIKGKHNARLLGNIYELQEDGTIEYTYKEAIELKIDSPVLMDCFLTPKNAQNNFLNKWNIIYAGDSYDMSKKLYWYTVENFIEVPDGKIPTRVSFEEQKTKKIAIERIISVADLILTAAAVLGDPTLHKQIKDVFIKLSKSKSGLVTYTVDGVTKYYRVSPEDQIAFLGKGDEVLKNKILISANEIEKPINLTEFNSVYSKTQAMNKKKINLKDVRKREVTTAKIEAFSAPTHSVNGDINTLNTATEFQTKIGNSIEKMTTGTLTISSLYNRLVSVPQEFKFTFQLSGLNVVILQNIETSQYVLAIGNTKELKVIDTQLSKKIIPEEAHFLLSFYILGKYKRKST